MIHRAILGTLERFSAVLIEHYAGAFPLWLAPEQVRVVPVADRHVEHAAGLASALHAASLRSTVDESHETVGKKIRASALMKVPYTIVVGDRDIEAGTVSIRGRGERDVRGVDFDRFVSAAAEEAATRSLDAVDLEALV
jgi:threonyl-tRNA synthetase